MFDPEVVPYAKLVEQATAKECATPVFARTEAQLETARELAGERATLDTGEVKTDDDKFYLSRSILKHLPLTPMQASRVNALVGEHEDPTPLLAPSQRALLERIRKVDGAGWPVAIGVPLLEAWKAVPPQ